MKIIPPEILLGAYTRGVFPMAEEGEMRDYEVKILKPQINVDERRWQKRLKRNQFPCSSSTSI